MICRLSWFSQQPKEDNKAQLCIDIWGTKKTRRLTSQLSSQIESDTYISTNVCNKAAGKLLSTYISHIVSRLTMAPNKKGLIRICFLPIVLWKKILQGEILSGKAVFPICNASDAGAWLGCIVMHSHGKFVFCSVNVIWDICSSTLSSSTSSCSDDDMFEELAGI